MQKDNPLPFELDRRAYAQRMAQNLPTLRARLGLTQTELAQMIGITRQTLSAAESGARELTWGTFLSLLYVFTQNEDTIPLLEALEIYTPQLAEMFRVTGAGRLRRGEKSTEKEEAP